MELAIKQKEIKENRGAVPANSRSIRPAKKKGSNMNKFYQLKKWEKVHHEKN
jgi:hypothetical protein